MVAAWQQSPDDPTLAARWAALEDLPPGTLGQAVTRFYRARGFQHPGRAGSVSPLLAQHDWVRVLADYGATIDNELEEFAFIARAGVRSPGPFEPGGMTLYQLEAGQAAAAARGDAYDTWGASP